MPVGSDVHERQVHGAVLDDDPNSTSGGSPAPTPAGGIVQGAQRELHVVHGVLLEQLRGSRRTELQAVQAVSDERARPIA